MGFNLNWRKKHREEQPTEEGQLQTKASVSARLIAMQGLGAAHWSTRDSASLTRLGYMGNPIGFRAIRMVAEAAAALPLVLQDETQRYESHPVLSLMTRPNFDQTRQDFLEALFSHLLLAGNAYVEAQRRAQPPNLSLLGQST